MNKLQIITEIDLIVMRIKLNQMTRHFQDKSIPNLTFKLVLIIIKTLSRKIEKSYPKDHNKLQHHF